MTFLSSKRAVFSVLLAMGLTLLANGSFAETDQVFADSEVLQIQGESFYTSEPDSGYKERDAVTKTLLETGKVSEAYPVTLTRGNNKFYFDKYLLFMKDANAKKPKVLIDIETEGQLLSFDDFFFCRDSEGNLIRFDYKGNRTAVLDTAGYTYLFDDQGAVYVEQEAEGALQLYRCKPNENKLRLVYSGDWEGFGVDRGNLIYVHDNAFYENTLEGKASRLIYTSKDAVKEWACFNHQLYWMTFEGKSLQADLNGESVQEVFDKRVNGLRQVGKQLLFNVCEKEGGIFLKDSQGNSQKVVNADVAVFSVLGDSIAYVNGMGVVVVTDLKTNKTIVSDVKSCRIDTDEFKLRLVQSAQGIVIHETFGRIYRFDSTLRTSELIETEDIPALGGSDAFYYVNRETNELCKLSYLNGSIELVGTSFLNQDDEREYQLDGVKTKMVSKGGYQQLSIMDVKTGKALLQKKLVSKATWLGGHSLLVAEKGGNIGIYNTKSKKLIDLKYKTSTVKGELRVFQCGSKTVLMDDNFLFDIVNNSTGESVLKDQRLKALWVGEIKGTTLMLHEISDATIIFYDLKSDTSTVFEFIKMPAYESAELIGNRIYFYDNDRLLYVYDTVLKKLGPLLAQ